MLPLSVSDRDDFPRPCDDFVPGRGALVEEIVVGAEDAVGEPVVSHELAGVLGRVKLGRTWRHGEDDDVGGHVELARGMLSGLIYGPASNVRGAWNRPRASAESDYQRGCFERHRGFSRHPRDGRTLDFRAGAQYLILPRIVAEFGVNVTTRDSAVATQDFVGTGTF